MPLFLAPRQLKPFISQELLDGPLKPIDYVDGDRVVRGYDASILVAVCGVWLEARKQGALQKQQLGKAQAAEALTLALADTGVVALIDEATGYQDERARDALAKIFCPCCNRTFKQLAAHMASQHPTFTPLDIDQGAPDGATVQ